MKRFRVGMLCLIAVAGLAGTTMAEAESGFGVFAGFAAHSSKGQFTIAPADGPEFEFTSQGLSFGIDYQFAISSNFSISPFLISSREQFQEESSVFSAFGADATNGVHGILGVQLRFWIGDLFVGGHVGRYSELISFDLSTGGSDDTGFVGTGVGAIVGWESPSGLFIAGQVDSAMLKANDDEAETDLTGTRVHVGYRWK